MSTSSDSLPIVIEISDSTDESDGESGNAPVPSDSSTATAVTVLSDNPESSSLMEAEITVPASRRKSAHQTINSTEDISFQSFDRKDDHRSDGGSEGATTIDLDDPETMQFLKKIAYCRVFTNYLLRQYDMLAIDFQIPSNLDELLAELKKRVDAYKAIRRSRMQLLQNKEN